MKYFTTLNIDTIEIIKLIDYTNIKDIVNGKTKNADFLKKCSKEEQDKIFGWWNSFKGGEVTRCHFPVYALKIFDNNHLVGVATFCWACDNIYIWQKDKGIDYILFDGTSKEAQAFLSFCDAIK